MMAVNVEAPLFLTQLVAPHLIETKGNVVNTSSCGTTMIMPNSGAYVMTKAAIDTFTRYLAQELSSHGVRVNLINPGYVPTNVLSKVFTKDVSEQMNKAMTKAIPIGRTGTPEDMGHAVAFLASDKAAFVTGESVRVDGGLSMTTPALG